MKHLKKQAGINWIDTTEMDRSLEKLTRILNNDEMFKNSFNDFNEKLTTEMFAIEDNYDKIKEKKEYFDKVVHSFKQHLSQLRNAVEKYEKSINDIFEDARKHGENV